LHQNTPEYIQLHGNALKSMKSTLLKNHQKRTFELVVPAKMSSFISPIIMAKKSLEKK
jgi:hypothetical protein